MYGCERKALGGGLKTLLCDAVFAMTKTRMAATWMALTLVLGAPVLLAKASQAAFDAKRIAEPRDLDDDWLVYSGDNPSYADT